MENTSTPQNYTICVLIAGGNETSDCHIFTVLLYPSSFAVGHSGSLARPSAPYLGTSSSYDFFVLRNKIKCSAVCQIKHKYISVKNKICSYGLQIFLK